MGVNSIFLFHKVRFKNSKPEDFLEGEFFGGEVVHKQQHLPHPPVRVFKTFADFENQQTPLLF